MSDPDAGKAHDRRIVGDGTPSEVWASWSGWSSVPRCDLDTLVPVGTRLVVLAPHPDDEVLGCGGLLQLACDAGRAVSIIAVTDGEASHPGSTRWSPDLLIGQRHIERARALADLGIGEQSVTRLGFHDGQISTSAIELGQALGQLLTSNDVVVSPWRFDGHSDHEAVANVAAEVCELSRARHLEMPIWGWHWASPEAGQFPFARAVILPLGQDATRQKAKAAHHFLSQLEPDASTGASPILPASALKRLLCECEMFFR